MVWGQAPIMGASPQDPPLWGQAPRTPLRGRGRMLRADAEGGCLGRMLRADAQGGC
jgi:hypothetical protein